VAYRRSQVKHPHRAWRDSRRQVNEIILAQNSREHRIENLLVNRPGRYGAIGNKIPLQDQTADSLVDHRHMEKVNTSQPFGKPDARPAV